LFSRSHPLIHREDEVQGVLQDAYTSTVVDDNTGSENAYRMIEHWVNTCLLNHPQCRSKPSLNKEEVFLPTRVIDVGPSDGSQEPVLRLGKNQNGLYIALSHCWGLLPMITTTTTNIEQHMSSIPMASLPKTFQDAITTCRRLRIRNLWIDSLCIVQDSLEDWTVEATTMGDVYKRAYLTIAAVSATNSSIGCYMPRNGLSKFPCRLNMKDDLRGGDKISPVFARLHRDHMSQVFVQLRKPDVIDDRAWVLQERVLSPRIVNYAKDQIYWDCVSMEASEQVPEGLTSELAHDMSYMRIFQEAIVGATDLSNKQSVDHLYASWYRITMQFTARKLTKETDKLYALSGLASEMQKALKTAYELQDGIREPDIYIDGLWRNQLWRGLIWVTHWDNRSSKRTKFRAPSWSWASTNSFITYFACGSQIKDLEAFDPVDPVWWEWEVCVKVVSVNPCRAHSNMEVGESLDGALVLRSKIKEAVPENLYMHDPVTNAKLGMFFPDETDWIPKPVICIEIAAKKELQGARKLTWCLLLESTESIEGHFRRVGALALEAVDWLDEKESETITIV
jgi:hypothetical protein